MFYNSIKELQIENTSICNAACPMCLRENTPEDKSWFEETYLPTEFFDCVPDEVMQNLDRILLNGVLGDPAAAPNLIEICESMLSRSPKAFITISTNGGLKSEEFWSRLAAVLKDRGRVVFAIDGLVDTNHIYRVNVRWDKVIKNAQAFINAGGYAEWQFITFKHNAHQVAEAEELSRILGFKHFFVKPSHRFTLSEMTGKNTVVQPINFVPRVTLQEWKAQSEHSTIDCYAQRNQTIYIEYTGRLFPCCPLSSGNMYKRTVDFGDGWNTLWDTYGGDKISLKEHSWNDIVNGPFFKGVQESWDKDYANGRLAACAGVCSNSKIKFNHKE